VELIRRCGYKNIPKGLRRLEDLRGGEFQNTRGLISGLPQALDVPAELVQKAIDDTTRQRHEAYEAAWRAAFRPHAIILTDRRIPQPIFVAAMIGVYETESSTSMRPSTRTPLPCANCCNIAPASVSMGRCPSIIALSPIVSILGRSRSC
jgi:hypothetical protein